MWSRLSALGDEFNGRDELLYSPSQLELYGVESTEAAEFAARLVAPALLEPVVTRSSVELRWETSGRLDELRDELRDHPLLSLGFRVYRWRDGGEPALVTDTDEGGSPFRTTFRDTDLPLWSERFFYSVATVLEGRVAGQPTLIESRRSSVTEVETLDNFALEVIGGTTDTARIRVSTELESGRWSEFLELGPGDSILLAPPSHAPDPFDTGLRLVAIDERPEATEIEVERAEFEPDGRRRVDPGTGLPTFRRESRTATVRTLELRCEDRDGRSRTFRSPPLR